MSAAHPHTSALAAPRRLPFLVLLAAGLAAAASIGLAWTVGFERVLTGLTHPRWEWLAVAAAGEAVAYLGYTAAYREVARAEGGASEAGTATPPKRSGRRSRARDPMSCRGWRLGREIASSSSRGIPRSTTHR